MPNVFGLNDFQRNMIVSWLPPGTRFVFLACADGQHMTLDTNLDENGVEYMLRAALGDGKEAMAYCVPVPAGDNIFVVEQFIDMCQTGLIKQGDGTGYPVKAGFRSEQTIIPDRLADIPTDATHIIWLARDEDPVEGEAS